MADTIWDVVAGIEVGLTENHVMYVNLKTGEKRDCLVKGHNLYVRKCERAEEAGGILIPEKSRKDTVFALVLAIGTECGTFRRLNKQERKRQDMRSSVVLGVEVNDKIMGPDDHPWAITRSPWVHDDFFIDECAVSAVVPFEE